MEQAQSNSQVWETVVRRKKRAPAKTKPAIENSKVRAPLRTWSKPAPKVDQTKTISASKTVFKGPLKTSYSMPRSQGAATTGGGSHGRISKKGSKEEAPKKPEQQQEPEQPKGTKEAKNSSETTQDDVAVEKVVPTQPESRPASKQSSRPTSSQVDPDKSCTPTAEFVQRPQAMSWAEEVEVSIQQHVTQRSTSPENELPGADPMIDSKSCTEDVDSIPSAADENPIHDGSVVEAPDAPIQEAPEHVDSSSSTADEDPTQDDDSAAEAPVEPNQETAENDESSSSSAGENPTQNDDSAAEAPVEPNQETAEHANPGSQPVQAVSRSTPNSTQLNVDDSTAETLDGAQQNITDEVRNSAESLFHSPDARARVRLPPAAEPQQTLLDEPQEPQEPQELAGPQSQDVDVPSEQPAVPPHTSAAKNPQCPQNGQQQCVQQQEPSTQQLSQRSIAQQKYEQGHRQGPRQYTRTYPQPYPRPYPQPYAQQHVQQQNQSQQQHHPQHVQQQNQCQQQYHPQHVQQQNQGQQQYHPQHVQQNQGQQQYHPQHVQQNQGQQQYHPQHVQLQTFCLQQYPYPNGQQYAGTYQGAPQAYQQWQQGPQQLQQWVTPQYSTPLSTPADPTTWDQPEPDHYNYSSGPVLYPDYTYPQPPQSPYTHTIPPVHDHAGGRGQVSSRHVTGRGRGFNHRGGLHRGRGRGHGVVATHPEATHPEATHPEATHPEATHTQSASPNTNNATNEVTTETAVQPISEDAQETAGSIVDDTTDEATVQDNEAFYNRSVSVESLPLYLKSESDEEDEGEVTYKTRTLSV
ncbi:hypothetical protein VD0002_g1496 [Verticillium dahliae]|nr:hypothetical protein VD0002_g1496 [Verticillium dahliae]